MNSSPIATENTTPVFSCKLTTPALQQRKKTVITSLQKKVLEKKELDNGFAYKFNATDQLLDELITFIKTERVCCDFFNFNLTINTDTYVWLEIYGPDGVKDFIKAELAL